MAADALRDDLREALGDPHLARILDELRAKYVASRKAPGEIPSGVVVMETHEEADALSGLIGKRGVRKDSRVRVREIAELFETKTRFKPLSLREALEIHRGEPIVSRREIRAERDAGRERMRERFLATLAELGASPEEHARVVAWMDEDRKVLRTWQTKWGEEPLARAFRAVAAALSRLPGRGGPVVFLAELAAAAAGDPHAFDVGARAGAMLNRALAHRFPETARRGTRGGASWRRSLLAEAGIARDSISSRVDTYGLTGDTPYLQALRASGLDRPLTLRSLGIVEHDVRAWRDTAFIVENPTVFEALLGRLDAVDRSLHPTILCTNGNLNLADTGLLDALARSGARLFYSGDFDPAGLEIAAIVLARYPASATLWRMTPADYRLAVRPDTHASLDPDRLRTLSDRFPDVVAEMIAIGRTGDQEKLIDALAGDVIRFGMESSESD
ncbi:MAG TPA: TIGR02679 family protein [Longimicrobium sp.]|nr:TIGR02679 family protein [Longimicrobium sp.]